MALYLNRSKADSGDPLDISEALGLVPEADKYKGAEKWMFIAQLMSRMTGEIKYIETFIKKVFANGSASDVNDGYRDTSILLDGIAGYGIRLNRWKPLGNRPIDVQADIGLAYDVPHNHDFQLVTKGIWGPGYLTDIYRFDAINSAGSYNEDVELTYQGRFQLSPGSVIWFEEFSDVHIQRAPSALSMSLNLIPTGRTVQRGQLFFDIENSRISGFPETSYARVLALLTLLCEFGRNEEAYKLIVEIGSTTRNEWFRTAIAFLLVEKWGKEREQVFDMLKIGNRELLGEKYSASAFSSRHIM